MKWKPNKCVTSHNTIYKFICVEIEHVIFLNYNFEKRSEIKKKTRKITHLLFFAWSQDYDKKLDLIFQRRELKVINLPQGLRWKPNNVNGCPWHLSHICFPPGNILEKFILKFDIFEVLVSKHFNDVKEESWNVKKKLS